METETTARDEQTRHSDGNGAEDAVPHINEQAGIEGPERPQNQGRMVVRSRSRPARERQNYDDSDRPPRGHQQQRRGGGGYDRQGGGHYGGGGGGGAYNNAYASGINQAGMSSGFNFSNVSYAQGPLPELPELSSMPDLYGRPEPRGDDGGVTRLSINELTRMSMIDLREIASCYGISHEDVMNLRKQEIIFTLLKVDTDRAENRRHGVRPDSQP